MREPVRCYNQFKEEFKEPHVYGRSEMLKWFINSYKIDLFSGQKSIEFYYTQFICISTDKNYVHYYQFSTIYKVVEQLQNKERLR